MAKVGDKVKVLTQRETQPDPFVKHFLFKKQVVEVIAVTTDGGVITISEEGFEDELEAKDFVVI